MLGTDTAGADAVRLLEYAGHSVTALLTVSGGEILRAVDFLKVGTDALLVSGDTDAFFEEIKARYSLPPDFPKKDALVGTLRPGYVFEAEDIIFMIAFKLNVGFIERTAIPALNSKQKTFYATVLFKTFGETAEHLRELLAECIRNKNRIAVNVVEFPHRECEVRIRYSNKTNREALDALAIKISAILEDCAYSGKPATLPETVSELLKQRGQKVCVAESFTGGGIARALISVPGASRIVKEGIVSYSNESKIYRLNVEQGIIEKFGATSIETAYEMAANLLYENPDCAYAVATTGNAESVNGAPPSFLVASGDQNGIHIYRYDFEGTRNEVIEFGVKAALFRLCKKITESSFQQDNQ